MFESRTTSSYNRSARASVSPSSASSSSSSPYLRRKWNNSHNRNRENRSSRDISDLSQFISFDTNRVSTSSSSSSLIRSNEQQEQKDRSPMMESLFHKLGVRSRLVSRRRKRRTNRQRFYGQPTTKKMKNKFQEYTTRNKSKGHGTNTIPVGAAHSALFSPSAHSTSATTPTALALDYAPTASTQTGIIVPCDEYGMYFMLRSKSSSTIPTNSVPARSEESVLVHTSHHSHNNNNNNNRGTIDNAVGDYFNIESWRDQVGNDIDTVVQGFVDFLSGGSSNGWRFGW